MPRKTKDEKGRARLDYSPAAAAELRAWLADNHMTQAELAEKIGSTQTTVSAWVLEISAPSDEYRARLHTVTAGRVHRDRWSPWAS